MSKVLVVMGVGFLSLFSTKAEAQEEFHLPKPGGERDPGRALGVGYNSLTHEIRSSCVEPSAKPTAPPPSPPASLFRLREVRSYDELREGLDISAAAGADFGVFAGSFASRVERAVHRWNEAVYLLVRASVIFGEERMMHPVLTRPARLARQKGPSAFTAMCGDRFVVGLVRGTEYNALMKFAASASQETQSVSAAIAASALAWKANADVKSTMAALHGLSATLVVEDTVGGAGDTVRSILDKGKSFASSSKTDNAWVMAVTLSDYNVVENMPGVDFPDLSSEKYRLRDLRRIQAKLQRILDELDYAMEHPTQVTGTLPKNRDAARKSLQASSDRVNDLVKRCGSSTSRCREFVGEQGVTSRSWGLSCGQNATVCCSPPDSSTVERCHGVLTCAEASNTCHPQIAASEDRYYLKGTGAGLPTVRATCPMGASLNACGGVYRDETQVTPLPSVDTTKHSFPDGSTVQFDLGSDQGRSWCACIHSKVTASCVVFAQCDSGH